MAVQSEEQIEIMLRANHPILTLSRQLDVIVVMNSLDEALKSGVAQRILEPAGIKGIKITGSGGIPPNIRRAGDLDIDPLVGDNYNQVRAEGCFSQFILPTR